jgi:A/G-specific adenine glycosylase
MSLERLGPGEIQDFRARLLAWFKESARDLPWRRTTDPYAIWVSEIMLQQTRVVAVLEHYAQFLSRFPTLIALALAKEDEVLALWSGLGYYRRARMLHRAAQFVAEEYQGALPRNAAELRKLPGVGDYTSAAIASIAFGEAVAVVDGNVERVITRVAGLLHSKGKPVQATTAKVRRVADRLLDPNHPSDFNQAMMELGATVCLPRNPMCLHCPVQQLCKTQGEHLVQPAKKMRSVQVAYALVRRESARNGVKIFLEKRSASASVMPGMWELPQIDPDALSPSRELLAVRHAITQTNYYATVAEFSEEELEQLSVAQTERRWMSANSLLSLPLTGLTRKVLKRLAILPAMKHS